MGSPARNEAAQLCPVGPLSTNHTFSAGSSCTSSSTSNQKYWPSGRPEFRVFARVLATSQMRTRLRRVETRYFFRNARLVQLWSVPAWLCWCSHLGHLNLFPVGLSGHVGLTFSIAVDSPINLKNVGYRFHPPGYKGLPTRGIDTEINKMG